VQVRASGDAPFPEAEIGDELIAQGALQALRERPRSDFDYVAYLRRAGVHAVVYADTVTLTGRRRGGARGLVDHLRRRAEEGAGQGLDPPMAALARGMVLGQDERIPARMAEDFKSSGLAHLLAVSGQNVTLLSLLALPGLAVLGLGRRARLISVLGLIAVYVPLTGAGPSIMRAGAMGAAGTVAALAGRPASRWYAVLVATAFTLMLDPRAWMDPGWQLSFAAVVGIFFLAPRLTRALHRLPDGLASGVAVTVAATVATAPLMAFHFERVSIVSLMANLLALPVVAPIMWTGMAAAASSQVWVEPAALLNALNGYCLAYLAALAHWSAGFPGSVWWVRIGSPAALASAYAILAAVILMLPKAGRLFRGSSSSSHWVPVAAATALVLGLAAWAPWSAPTVFPKRFTVSFLDVGQGDATLIQTPSGASALVDGGPPQVEIASKLRAAGVRSLDLVVLTHAQADHEGGLETVLRAFHVAALLDGGAGA
jgi:competence protein ComEC